METKVLEINHSNHPPFLGIKIKPGAVDTDQNRRR
jgi:hypothetical protein